MNTLVKQHNQKMEISINTLNLAKNSIIEFASKRKLVIKGEISLSIPTFSSKSQEKAFQDSLKRVIEKPTMKNCNIYLRKMESNCKLDYSEQEKSIQSARKEWKKSEAITLELLKAYKSVKGDFYKK